METPKFIRDPIKDCDAGRKRIVEGIIKSAYLTTFQHQAIEGIIKSPMTPTETKEAKSKKTCKPKTRKGDALATPQQIGMVHFPGSPYPKRR